MTGKEKEPAQPVQLHRAAKAVKAQGLKGTSTSEFGDITPYLAAEYAAQLCGEIAQIAKEKQLVFLAHC